MRNLATQIRDRVTQRKDIAALLRELGEHVGGAARAPENLAPRDCPICERSDAEPQASVRGPVYAFHRCRGCSLLYAPQVLKHQVTRKLYSERPIYRSYWEHMRSDAEAMKGRTVYGPLVQKLLALAPGRDVAIDVGAGFGKLASELAPHFHDVVGLELNRRTAQVGGALFGVTLRSERIEKIDRPDGSVDLIVMNQVLEHLHDVWSVFRAAQRLLKPRGVLYVGIPHGGSVGMKVLGGGHPYVATHMHVNMFNAASLETLVTRAGFEVRELRTDDSVDVSAADLVLERIPAGMPWLAAPAFAVDKVVHRVAAVSGLPSRLGLGGHLEAVLVKP